MQNKNTSESDQIPSLLFTIRNITKLLTGIWSLAHAKIRIGIGQDKDGTLGLVLSFVKRKLSLDVSFGPRKKQVSF